MMNEATTSTTSGTIVGSPTRATVVAGMLLVGIGTSSTATAAPVLQQAQAIRSTNSGSVLQTERRSREALAELRRCSGLTLEQLARLFTVSRRTIHFWLNGRPLAAAHEEHLFRTLGTIQQVDRGSPDATRRLLLTADGDGSLLELLARGCYEEVLSKAAAAPVMRPRLALSAEERAHRRPPSPATLLDTAPDRPHRETGRLVSGRSADAWLRPGKRGK